MSRYYDRTGKEITAGDWSLEDNRVDLTKVEGPSGETAEVSTVYLGLDHQYGDDGPPLIFETLIMGGVYDQDMARYSTEDQAREGHAAAVAQVRRALHSTGIDAAVLAVERAREP